MKIIKTGILVLFAIIIVNCGSNSSEDKDSNNTENNQENANESVVISEKMVESVDVAAEIDNSISEKGKSLFESKCTSCHDIEQKKIGPIIKGVTQRREAKWIMNMMLDPNYMIQNDETAKQLLMEANGAPMADQSLTKEEARSILEYFRTIDKQ